MVVVVLVFCFFKQKTAYDLRISDCSSDVCSSYLTALGGCASVTPCAVPANGTNVPASIAISVGPCFGSCPVYEAKIVADGIVSFTGTRHTTVLGTRERRAAPDTYHKLEADLASFRPAAGATTEVPCGAEISALPSSPITWTSLEGQKAFATHRGGCREGAGTDLHPALTGLPHQLDTNTQKKQTTRPGVSRG